MSYYQELKKEVKQLNRELKELPDAFGVNSEKSLQLQKDIQQKTEHLMRFEHSVRVTNRSIGNYL